MTEEYSVGYEAGYEAGWNAAIDSVSPAAPVQEPVAYAVYHRTGGGKSLHWPEQHCEEGDASQYKLVPLYATPTKEQN